MLLVNTDDSDYIWLTRKAIDLYSGNMTWMQLDTASYSKVVSIAQKNTFSGFMASGAASYIGLLNYNWTDVYADSTGSAIPGMRYTQNTEAAPATDGLSVYPNPTTGSITVTLPEAAILNLYNLQGQIVATWQLHEGSNDLVLPTGITAGLYIGSVRYADGSQKTVRISYRP